MNPKLIFKFVLGLFYIGEIPSQSQPGYAIPHLKHPNSYPILSNCPLQHECLLCLLLEDIKIFRKKSRLPRFLLELDA
jgi:hypothetical protein